MRVRRHASSAAFRGSMKRPVPGIPQRWLSAFFLLAAAAGALNSVLPGYPGFDIPALLAMSAGALAIGIALLRTTRPVPAWMLHALVALGSACVAAAIHFTEGVPNDSS